MGLEDGDGLQLQHPGFAKLLQLWHVFGRHHCSTIIARGAQQCLQTVLYHRSYNMSDLLPLLVVRAS